MSRPERVAAVRPVGPRPVDGPAQPRQSPGASGALRAVLFDRDGTLVRDVPYNGDPDLVEPMPGAVEAVARVRAAGLRTGVVTNQSGVARGLLGVDDVRAVAHRVDELFGAFDVWEFCPHGPDERCRCRKPAPGLVLDAAARLGVAPQECAVVGDIAADLGAAAAAGARGVLVPTPVTLPAEVSDAARTAEVAADLGAAVDLLLAPDRRPGPEGAA